MHESTILRPSFKHVRAIRACLHALILTVLCTASALHAADQDQVESMRNSVLALDSARQTALQEIGSSPLPGEEADDYQDFIVYLNTRIVNYCTELAEQGDAATLEGLPCPAASAMGHGENEQADTEETFIYLPVAEPQETQTQAEKTASMDRQLFASLGEFDELLLKEEDKISSRVPSQRESGNSGLSGSGGSSAGTGESGDGTGEGGDQGGQSAQVRTPSGSGSGAGAGDAGIDHSAYGAPGGKLPPPQDDDIVARQLREAAEKETDPELKKKLWEEYWKYKGVKKGGMTGQ